jgi:hypothetical protein
VTDSIEKRIETDPAVQHAVNETVPTGDGGGRAPTRYEKGRRAEEIAKRSHKKKPQSAGVGPSKAFIADPGTFEETRNWSTLTINGQPIPEHLWTMTPYTLTDQGAAELNAGKQPRRAEVLREAPLASQGVSELLRTLSEETTEQAVARYRESIELMEQEDPLGVLLKRHTPPGRRGRWMSNRVTGTVGMRRAGMDYEPVLVNGERVEHGKGERGMFLASVPEQLAQAAEQHFTKKGRDLVGAAIAKVAADREEVMGEAGIRRLNRRGDLPDSGIEFLAGDGAEMQPGNKSLVFEG